jgi:hypothetical protein
LKEEDNQAVKKGQIKNFIDIVLPPPNPAQLTLKPLDIRNRAAFRRALALRLRLLKAIRKTSQMILSSLLKSGNYPCDRLNESNAASLNCQFGEGFADKDG